RQPYRYPAARRQVRRHIRRAGRVRSARKSRRCRYRDRPSRLHAQEPSAVLLWLPLLEEAFMQLRSTWIASFVCVLCWTSADPQSGGAYLGDELGSPAPDLQKRFGGGVLILGVMPGGPAEKAGLKQGDMILDADRENVNTPQDVVDIVHDFAPGEMLELYIVDPSSGNQPRTIDG